MLRKISLFILLVVLLGLLLVPGASAATLNVDNSGGSGCDDVTGTPYCTIQAAIDDAGSGDIINIAAGTYAENVVIDKSLTLHGAGAGTILDGTTLGTASGIHVNSGVTDVTIEDLIVQNYTTSGFSTAGIFAAGSNDNFIAQRLFVNNNTGGAAGLYMNGPVDNVLIDDVEAHNNTTRGIVIWNGHKTNITITNNDVQDNNCCGIELQDGTASGVTMTGNTVINNGDSGLSAIGLMAGTGPNLIADNTVTDNGRFGIEIKLPNGTGLDTGDGSIVIEDNTVSFTTDPAMNARDHAGIAVFRRAWIAGPAYVDIPTGVIVRDNAVSGYQQTNPASSSTGFGIVVEGTNMQVYGNTLNNNDVGVQVQAGHLPYTPNSSVDGDQSDLADDFFGRGNSPVACAAIANNNFSGNGVDSRSVGAAGGGTVTNLDTSEIFCSVQEAIDDVNTLDGHTLEIGMGTSVEDVLVDKELTLQSFAPGGDFSQPPLVDSNQKPGYWYPDRYPPAVFDSYNFGGEMVLRHGISAADFQTNSWYNYQGRKLDTGLSGNLQSMKIDVWVDPSWETTDSNAGLWATGSNVSDVISAYPIIVWRNPSPDPAGFYAFDYINGGYLLLREATSEDYGKWHTLSFDLKVGTGTEFFVDGESLLEIADPDTAILNNVILNVYNYGFDYDVYWDNFQVQSDDAATYESAIEGQVDIEANNVTINGLSLSNPDQPYGVFVPNHTPSFNNITLTNNRIHHVGSGGTAAQVKGVYLNYGPDDVTIENNFFSDIASGTKSANAIFVGDSASTNSSTGILIQENTFVDITAFKGAYGILINNGSGTPGVQVLDNTFSSLDGSWTHAVGMEGDTLNAVVTGNRFSDLTATGSDKSAVFFEANPSGDTVTISDNQFNGSGFYGVAIHPNDLPGGSNGLSYVVDASNNWWDAACGPDESGPGSGAGVGPNVTFSPWLTAPEGSTTASQGSGGEIVLPDGSSTAEIQAVLACASGKTVIVEGTSCNGGLVVDEPDVTVNLNGCTFGPGSPAFTVNAANFTLLGPGVLDGTAGAPPSPAVVINSGGDNFIMQDVEVRNWTDGVDVTSSVNSFKLAANWFHDNSGAGLNIQSGVALGGVVTVEGNLFKFNGGNGIENSGSTALNAQYNSWGDIAGAAAGDGVSANVDASNPTFAEVYADVEPDTLATSYAATESVPFDVAVKVDAAGLYAVQYVLTYDDTMLSLNSVTNGMFEGTGTCVNDTATAGVVNVFCTRFIPDADVGGTQNLISTINFTPTGTGLTGAGPWATMLDISTGTADLSAGARGGVKVYVNNGGFGNPASPDPIYEITDMNDGEINITGVAEFTGFVDLQGRTNDSGASISVNDVLDIVTSTELANATSASSGGYTTSYISDPLTIGTTYYLWSDAYLYLPTTAIVDTDYANNKAMSSRPTTTLDMVLLLGGDATNNDIIDINDASCIGGDYGVGPDLCGVDGSSDVNADGAVNILDLVLMGGNYELTSSPWTP